MGKITDLQSRVDKLPRIKLAKLPTPLEEIPNLTRVLGGPKLWIKRDDLTGMAFGGNKERGVEFIMADAIQKKADVIITAGDVQSNHTRAVAAVASKLGLKVVLALKGEEPQEYDGNLLLDCLFGAETKVVQGDWEQVVLIMEQAAKELEKNGHKPYIVPNSGSYPIGAIGYFNLMLELVKQAERANLNINYIIHASGSGGAQAGLILANKTLRTGIKILGICVESNIKKWLTGKIVEIANGMTELLDLRVTVHNKDITLIDDYVGKGFGVVTPEAVKAIKLVAQTEGILLDPVYTSKAMAGLVDLIKRRRFKKDNNIVFVHTGGTPALFAYKNCFNI